MVNDIWGLKHDDKMPQIVAEANIPYCLMHNRANQNYNNFFEDFIGDINKSLDIAHNAGIAKENIILDGGVGFAKIISRICRSLTVLMSFASWGIPL